MSEEVTRKSGPSKSVFGALAGLFFVCWVAWWVAPWVFNGFEAPVDLTRDRSAFFAAVWLPIIGTVFFSIYLLLPRTVEEKRCNALLAEMKKLETPVSRLEFLARHDPSKRVRRVAEVHLNDPKEIRNRSITQEEIKRQKALDQQQPETW